MYQKFEFSADHRPTARTEADTGKAHEPSPTVMGQGTGSRAEGIHTKPMHGLKSWWAGDRPLKVKSERELTSFMRRQRVLVDLPVSVVAIVALSPIMAVAALLIKLNDGGPVVFRQERIGLNGKPFQILKFRSMRVEDGDPSGRRQTLPNDSRATVVGRLLRATSIDELPQLWNVLRGDLSMVGPRPMVAGQEISGRPAREIIPDYDFRTQVRPGLTGWAQAHGYRGPTMTYNAGVGRFEHDVAYIQNASCLLDYWTMLLTFVKQVVMYTGV
jgi:lipopolysaccharide/colanic/teichoic acid biosynthesis glycosyltransferase